MVGLILLLAVLSLLILLPVLTVRYFIQKKWIKALIFLGLSVIYIFFMVLPAYLHSRHCAQYVGCESNLKNIGTLLELYSSEHGGDYPKSLRDIAPRFIKVLPVCPAARRDTYTHSYHTSGDRKAYTVYCEGNNHRFYLKEHHANHAAGFPEYDSFNGLITDH